MKCLSAALATLISCMLFSCTFPENDQSDKAEENSTEILLEDMSMDILFTPEGEPTDIGDFTVILAKGWSFRTDQGTDPPLKGPGGISGSITVRLNNVPVTDTTRKEYAPTKKLVMTVNDREWKGYQGINEVTGTYRCHLVLSEDNISINLDIYTNNYASFSLEDDGILSILASVEYQG